MFKKLVMIALTSGLALWLGRMDARARDRSLRDRKQAVQRWEDEGGRVPGAAPRAAP